ncbi:MAG: nucleotidyltransferase domain-containing protein [Deltaproteobacteria bacterium]|nr:MAG: nucleotidyltransferase domain-containing protein [Deltaproteobacteria bacterium]
MDKVSDAVLKTVFNFINIVSQKKKLQLAYIYGSQATGTAKPWSDIDVAIISRDFSNNLYDEQLELMQLAAKIDDRIEPRAFLPEDFNRNNPLVAEIENHGLKII